MFVQIYRALHIDIFFINGVEFDDFFCGRLFQNKATYAVSEYDVDFSLISFSVYKYIENFLAHLDISLVDLDNLCFNILFSFFYLKGASFHFL